MARKKLSSAANTTRDTYHLLEKRTADSIKATDRMVRKHPYKSTGIGVGIGIGMGLIAGMMLMNRRRHSLFSWK